MWTRRTVHGAYEKYECIFRSLAWDTERGDRIPSDAPRYIDSHAV